jgi:antitoxin component of MazEF toxin-antitoxin module
MTSQSTLRATGGSVTTTIPSEVAERMGVGPGQSIVWIDEGDGSFRVSPAEAVQQPMLDAADTVIAKYRPVFAKLAREEG